jgi:hypothetical protein
VLSRLWRLRPFLDLGGACVQASAIWRNLAEIGVSYCAANVRSSIAFRRSKAASSSLPCIRLFLRSHFGLLGLPQHPASLTQLAGTAFLILGVVLIRA